MTPDPGALCPQLSPIAVHLLFGGLGPGPGPSWPLGPGSWAQLAHWTRVPAPLGPWGPGPGPSWPIGPGSRPSGAHGARVLGSVGPIGPGPWVQLLPLGPGPGPS